MWYALRLVNRTTLRSLVFISALLILPPLLTGCGVGGLIAGIVFGISAALDSGSSPPIPVTFDLQSNLDRRELRESGDANLVPVCFETRNLDPLWVRVEFARESDAFSSWQSATRTENPSAPCPSGASFWWDAGADLDLDNRSETVRLRWLSGDAILETSRPFVVGNSAPDIELLPTSDEEGNIAILFSARDAEQDPLLDLQLSYRIGDEGSVLDIELDPPLPRSMPAPSDAAVYSRQWDSRVVISKRGRRNLDDVRLVLRARDSFGLEMTSELQLRIRNNQEPLAELIGAFSELDSSFEIPVPFLLLDPDEDGRQGIDLVIQYAVSESPGFPELPIEWSHSDIRRDALRRLDDDSRRALGIISLSSRGQESFEGLTASSSGERHVLLWDSIRDLETTLDTSLRLRLTPYDQDEQGRSFVSGFKIIDNRSFQNEMVVARSDPPTVLNDPCDLDADLVSAFDIGDIDGDGRLDFVIALPEAENETSPRRGRIDIHLRAESGVVSSVPAQRIVPGSQKRGMDANTGDLVTEDINADGRLDLILLNTYCSRCSSCSQIGEVAIYYGLDPGIDGQLFPEEPDQILEAGQDSRLVCVGHLRGSSFFDIAVLNHDGRDDGSPPCVGVYFGGADGFAPAVPIPLDAAPRSMLCADVRADPAGREEIVVLEGDQTRIFTWNEDSRDFDFWTSIDSPSPRTISCADFNSDGRLDILIGKTAPNAISIHLNQGTGASSSAFDSGDSVALDMTPDALIARDVTGDGRTELTLVEQDQNLIEILVQNDEGQWSLLDTIHVDLHSSDLRQKSELAYRDIDGDGRTDLNIGTGSGLSLFRAEGAGSITATRDLVEIQEPGLVQNLLLADFDGDQRLDIGVTSSEARSLSYQVALYLQEATGQIPPSATRILRSRPSSAEFQSAFFASALVLPGIDAHVVALSRHGGIDLFMRHDSGSWGRPISGSSISEPDSSIDVAGSAAPVAVAILTDSDRPHVLRLSRLDARIDAFLVSANASSASLSANIPLEPLPIAFTVIDWNRDSLSDIAILGVRGTVEFLINRSQDEELTFEKRRFPGMMPPGSGSLLTRDLNGDGRADLLISSVSARKLIAWIAESDDPSSTLELRRYELDPGAAPLAFAAGNLNADDLPDLVVSVSSDSHLRLFYQQEEPAIFTSLPLWSIPRGETGPGPMRLAMGDVSGDTRDDLVILDLTRRRLEIRRGR